MANSIFNTVRGLMDSSSVDDIASRLGESRQSVSRGIETSTATLMDGMAHRAGDANWMSQIHNLFSQAPSDLNVSNLAAAAATPGTATGATASLLDSGKRLLSGVFGGNQSVVTEAIGRASGLRSGSTSILMSLAAPLLMTSVGRWIRETKATPGQLGGLFAEESAGVRNLVPAGVSEVFEGRAAHDTSRPLAVGVVQEHRHTSPWAWLLPVLVLVPLLFWLVNRARTPEMPQAGTAARTVNLGEFYGRTLPDGVQLNIPRNGVEAHLLDYIQDPTKQVDRNTWFDFDRLLFDTDSATLQPQSQEQLRNIAAILKAYPNVHIKIGGYTDNTGDSAHNLTLSQQRAENVMAEEVKLGITPDRLEAQGYGETHPVADNATEQGRQQNRRISMRITAK